MGPLCRHKACPSHVVAEFARIQSAEWSVSEFCEFCYEMRFRVPRQILETPVTMHGAGDRGENDLEHGAEAPGCRFSCRSGFPA
jgi:hypothetical protein